MTSKNGQLSPFDWINSITQDNKNGILEGSMDPEQYNPFIVNRGLSLFEDTIFYANAMNTRPDIPGDSQYHFLHTLIPKRRRWSKWPKKDFRKLDREFQEVLQTHYRYSIQECLEISSHMTDSQKKDLISLFTDQNSRKKAKKKDESNK